MSIRIAETNLPVQELVPEVRKALQTSGSLIVKAPPGAGKSTLLPLTLLNESWLEGKKIMMLEPRRLAAKSIATRMAELIGEQVGDTVGYRIRFDAKTSTRTRIEVLTEGILTRMLQQDNALEGIGLVIFDEFHERSLFADVAMALCRESQQVLRPDLRLLVMSATLDMQQLAQGLQAPVLESKGKMFPVRAIHEGESDVRMLPELTAGVIRKAVREHQGDVLTFLPGQGEIEKCAQILRSSLPEFSVLPLYGQLPQSKQHLALFPDKRGRRKIVLATSIAETSLTIQGIRIVVDTGLGRYSRFDPNSSLSRLVTEQISRDEADQRMGRAGRLSEGVCYRMWSKLTDSQLSEHRSPEIDKADLTSLVLDLALWGESDPSSLFWLTPPPTLAVQRARELLQNLEALGEKGITPHGKQMAQMSTHPRLAHMLLAAKKMNLLPLACDLAAILSERDFLPREAGTNINLRIEALRRFRKHKTGGKGIHFIEKTANSFRDFFRVEAKNGIFDEYETGLLLAHAYPERIACARPGNNAQFQLANGKMAMLGRGDDLEHEPWLAVAHADARSGVGKIFLASPIQPQDLVSMVKEKETLRWDNDEGGIVAEKQLCIGSIVLKSTTIENPDQEAVIDTICAILPKYGKQLLAFNAEVEQWQARVMSLRAWQPNESWPNVTTDTLLQNAKAWLSPYLDGVKRAQQIGKLPLLEILQASLDYGMQQQLDKLCPARIEVPSGSRIKIEYQINGAPPVLAVRLQEVFGWIETPCVNARKTPLLLHLLSPGFKPVQMTTDLNSFWNNAYFEVRKELKRRYPKHAWPDEPLQAEAVRGVKQKKK